MTDIEITSLLSQLTNEQLDALQEKLQLKVQEKKAERERRKKLPPRTSNDLEALADMQDLDLSYLLREVKKRS